MRSRISYITVAIVAFVAGPLLAYAWTSAPSNPPNSNVAAPVNVGSTAQYKAGTFQATALGADGNIVAGGDTYSTAYFYSSDERLKKDIQTLPDALSKIMQLRGVSFDWKKNGTPDIGVIAQEVQKVYPQLVTTDPGTGYESVQYGNLVAPLIEAVKEQQAEIQKLQAEVAELKAAQQR